MTMPHDYRPHPTNAGARRAAQSEHLRRRVHQLRAEGLERKAIAERLSISRATVTKLLGAGKGTG